MGRGFKKTMDCFLSYAPARGVGLIASALNAVAGGGSFLTLSFLIVFDLPASVGQMAPIVWQCFFKALPPSRISALGKQWNGTAALQACPNRSRHGDSVDVHDARTLFHGLSSQERSD
jgi:hypothetical protein